MRALLEAIQKHRVTVAILVPPLVVALTTNTAVEKYDLSSIRLVMSGAAPLGLQAEEALSFFFFLKKETHMASGASKTEAKRV